MRCLVGCWGGSVEVMHTLGSYTRGFGSTESAKQSLRKRDMRKGNGKCFFYDIYITFCVTVQTEVVFPNIILVLLH